MMGWNFVQFRTSLLMSATAARGCDAICTAVSAAGTFAQTGSRRATPMTRRGTDAGARRIPVDVMAAGHERRIEVRVARGQARQRRRRVRQVTDRGGHGVDVLAMGFSPAHSR